MRLYKSTFCLVTLSFLITLSSSCISTAKAQIPEAVIESFKAMYPNEDTSDWEKDANDNYEIQFKKDGEQHRADFTPDGKWIETEVSIDKDDLPMAVKNAIEQKYDDRKITEVEKVHHSTKGTFYDVEFKQKGKNLDIEFRENGTIIN
ncbi:PepSY-like domain-containing protein [Winogradskyella sp. A3E31]|uniref:PepSY-like domain-containing protein n=1 Tax=Winogradskyella sp. A3E31 TaxID=3349637 RepID=UPI00398B4248